MGLVCCSTSQERKELEPTIRNKPHKHNRMHSSPGKNMKDSDHFWEITDDLLTENEKDFKFVKLCNVLIT